MSVRYMQRVKRGCGTRKIGGTYLFFGVGHIVHCDRFPFPLPDACPCCGEEIRFLRSVRVVNPSRFWYEHGKNVGRCECMPTCPVCYPTDDPAGIMWVGREYYSPQSFHDEATEHGISKRVPAVPKNLPMGSLVFFVHLDGIRKGTPGVFMAARLSEIHRVISEKQAEDPKLIAEIEESGAVPVVEVGDVPEECEAPMETPTEKQKTLFEETA